jgi:hypothetical protein
MSLGETFDDSKLAIDIPPEPDPPATPLFAHKAKKKAIHPGDIHRVLSQSMAKGSAPPARKSVVQDGDILCCQPALMKYPKSQRISDGLWRRYAS